MREENNYERLLQALRDMQAQIEERMRPVAAQVLQAEVERLQSDSKRQQEALTNCINRIDEQLLSCRGRLDEYIETCAVLTDLNERLAELGEEPVQVATHVTSESRAEVILARVEALKVEGKI